MTETAFFYGSHTLVLSGFIHLHPEQRNIMIDLLHLVFSLRSTLKRLLLESHLEYQIPVSYHNETREIFRSLESLQELCLIGLYPTVADFGLTSIFKRLRRVVTYGMRVSRASTAQRTDRCESSLDTCVIALPLPPVIDSAGGENLFRQVTKGAKKVVIVLPRGRAYSRGLRDFLDVALRREGEQDRTRILEMGQKNLIDAILTGTIWDLPGQSWAEHQAS